jgi:integrase
MSENNTATVIALRPKSGAVKPTEEKERERLTDAMIKKLKPPANGNQITYDGDPPGFGIRVTAGGARSFVLSYRVRGTGRDRRYTIGAFPNWKTTAARERARELKKLIDAGGDPLADIEAEREAPTVADLIQRFVKEHLPRKRAGTKADYQRILDKHVKPQFGQHTKVADVTDEDIQRLHSKISNAGHLRRANTVVAVLSKMFSLSIKWKMRVDNPCKGIERNPEVERKRYLKEDGELGHELVRLTAALAAYPDQRTADIFRLLLLTGARRGEVLSMRWPDVDLTVGKWVKPGSTTKQKTDHEVPLSEPVRQLLSEIRAEQTRKKVAGEYVFPGKGDSGHIVAVKRAWKAICADAKFTGLRIHDLRHSFASQLVSVHGASLPLIGALLGHSNPATTARYTHLYDDPQRAAVEQVGAAIASAGQPAKKPKAKRRTKRRA